MRKGLFCMLLIILLADIAFAQSLAISNGLAWLKSTQSPEGYRGDVSEIPYKISMDGRGRVEVTP